MNEKIPQSTCVRKSLDHLLPEDKSQDFLTIKQETEFLKNTQSSQFEENKVIYVQLLSEEKDEKVKQDINFSDILETDHQTDSSSHLPEKIANISEKLYNKGCIDVIEMTVEPTFNYKYFLVYQDQFSKFVVLKALHSNTAKEVAANLLDVFGIIGAPRVLHSSSGRTFTEQVVYEIRSLWNDLFILHGDISNCEISRRDFKSLLQSWMRKNPTRTWCEGLNFIQIVHNSTYCCQNDKVPYDVLFRQNARENFQGMEKDMEGMKTEEEWLKYLSNKDGNVAVIEDLKNTSNRINVIIIQYNVEFIEYND
ncbi:hypothetical protein PUN28_010308 [Cardiocondyla obscurior]|uniref:Integrase catalytic domain-containing protein n=1 Tax=Cardiocondyla obscurior TaxID=286306 RepID=A0AAW2FQ36_9HYME